MNVLVIDVGGTNVKVWLTGESDCHKFSSGKKLTPQKLIEQVRVIAGDWTFDRVSLGYPGDVRNGRPAAEPWNLGDGWVPFDWSNAFEQPLRVMNDACMQALGSYEGGAMLYLGLGTGIGTAFIFESKIVPLALGHLPFRDERDLDHFLSRDGLKRHGAKEWNAAALEAGAMLKQAFQADYVVFGGGNSKKLDDLPDGFRKGGNHNAYFGGLRLWEDAQTAVAPKLNPIHQDDIPPAVEGGAPPVAEPRDD